MNVIVLYGSPHPSGSSSALLDSFVSGALESGGARFERFDAYDMDARPCIDCGACREDDTCVLGDLDELDAALRRCDAMVIASPVYHGSFPAPLKAVMDRTQRYFYAHRQGRSPFAGMQRPAYVLLSAGQRREDGDIIRRQLGWVLPALGMRLEGFVTAPGTDYAPPCAEVLSSVREMGRKMIMNCSGKPAGQDGI